MKKLFYVIIGVVAVAMIVNFLNPSVNKVTDLPFISLTEVFNRSEGDYAVYFYQDTCSICKEFEPILIDEVTQQKTPVYVVDMKRPDNTTAWYDWEAHHEKYDIVIGKVLGNGEILNEGESRDDYPSEDGWVIKTEGDDVIATNNKAMNNKNPQSAEELEIAGTPTLIRIIDGKVVAYGEGIDENSAILEKMAK